MSTRLVPSLLLAGSLSLVAGPASARLVPLPPDTLRGRVTTAAGNPLADVEIVVPELDRAARTGSDGGFVITSLPPGEHTVVLRRPGYAPVAQTVKLAGTAQLNVVLREAAFQMEPVVVTGMRAPVMPLLSVMPTATLSGDRVRQDQSVSLAHTLEAVAGVRTLSTGGEIGKPVIRGLTGSRILVADDGSRLEVYSWSDEDGPSVDARLADRVEVVRGPASVLYGSDALGGVVNVIPDPLPDALGRLPFTNASAETYFAANNHEFGGVLKMEGAHQAFGWRTEAIARKSEALHTPAGELDNTGFGALDGQVAGGLRGSWGSASLRYTRYGGEFKLLEAGGPPPGVTEGEEEGPERKLSDDRVQASGNFVAGGLRLETKAQWQRHWLQEVSDEQVPGGPAPVPGQESVQFDLLLNTVSLDVLAHHALGSAVRGTVGASGVFQDNDTRGPVPVVPDARTGSLALFGMERATVGRLSLVGGARVDGRRLTADANTVIGNAANRLDWSAVSGDLGAVLQPVEGLAFTVNAGRGWRAPTLFELFSAGPRIGEARYEIGRSDLNTERSFNLDAGARWQRGLVRAEVEAYRNDMSDYIYLAPTGDTVSGYQVYRHEQADAVLRGVEASLEVQPVTDFTLRARFDAVEGTNQLTGEPLPLMPPPRGGLEAEYETTELSWAARLYLSAEGEKYWTQTRLSSFDFTTEGYELLHFGAGIEKRVGLRLVRLDLRVRNAGNVSYKDFLSRYKQFALNPGRNIVVRLGADF
jgi:outer membrane receptor protein involved in Fe transport